MTHFAYRNQSLCAESVPLARIAEAFGTPCFVYSRAALVETYARLERALKGRDHLICYAVKANSNLAILNLYARLGSGFDVVSGGELARVLAAGGAAHKIVFSGVGKSAAELKAALEAGILCFNVESVSELLRLNRLAGESGKRASIALRVNPDVDPNTHPHIATGLKESKFGIAFKEAEKLYLLTRTLRNLRVVGIACHIGSQILEVRPFIAALEKMLDLVNRLEAQDMKIAQLDLGGGFGIRYRDETPPEFDQIADAIYAKLGHRSLTLLVEPGRALVGTAGVLLTKVEYLKHTAERKFAVVDAAMNDLMRPALYNAYHEVLPVKQGSAKPAVYAVVGPVCESADLLADQRTLAITEGHLLAICSAGAYGMSMSSNYNTRPRAAEVIVDGDAFHLIRRRESIEDLLALEKLLPS
ncbi:MAG TPA: diaminopimelate decarboxylase [Burkholderiales bacterium]|nr:diaminopimelate decarboxylase [Burkholderiales bacterium]